MLSRRAEAAFHDVAPSWINVGADVFTADFDAPRTLVLEARK